ncbi:MAG: CPBP family intramembrane metalloprotease [Bacteroidales bacterium]|nr:CPBP family intramembrane metalloprotease [Bacteroidales bacterium]
MMVPMILAPLVETLVYQYLPLRVCQKWFRRYKYSFCITIVLVSIVFGSRHAHMGVIGICNSLLAGIVWCFLCFVLMQKKRHPILYTTIMHACYNAVTIFGGIIWQQLF